MDGSSKLPAVGPGELPALVVATLDLNQGRALPAEELRVRLVDGGLGRCRRAPALEHA